MSTNTPQSDLTTAVADLAVLQGELASVGSSLSNAVKAKTLKAAQSSAQTGESRLGAAQTTTGAVLSSVQAALAGLNPTPPPPPPPSGGPQPNAPAGTFPGSMGLVFTGFDGVTVDTFDETIWTANEGGNQNDVTTHASNVSVVDGELLLQLASASSGATISTLKYALEVGHCCQATIWVPGTTAGVPYNWLAWWSGKESNWPADGEGDFWEGLGYASCGYQSPASTTNSVKVPGVWTNQWVEVAAYRTATQMLNFWNGQLVKAFATDDNGQPQSLVLTAGHDASRDTLVTGPSGALKVQSVYAWAPVS